MTECSKTVYIYDYCCFEPWQCCWMRNSWKGFLTYWKSAICRYSQMTWHFDGWLPFVLKLTVVGVSCWKGAHLALQSLACCFFEWIRGLSCGCYDSGEESFASAKVEICVRMRHGITCHSVCNWVYPFCKLTTFIPWACTIARVASPCQ